MTVGRSCIVAPSGTSAGPSASNHRRLPFTSTCIGAPEANGTFRAMRRALVLGGPVRSVARRRVVFWPPDGRSSSQGGCGAPSPRRRRSRRFVAAERSDTAALQAAFGSGADLLVDCICFTARGRAAPAARARRIVDGDDLEQGGVRRRRRQPLELRRAAGLRWTGSRDAGDGRTRGRRLPDTRGYARTRLRGGACSWTAALRSPSFAVEDPRRGATRLASGSSSSASSIAAPPCSCSPRPGRRPPDCRY